MPYLQPRKTPFKLTFIVKSQISSEVCCESPSSLCMIPALLNRMSSLPNCDSAA